MHICTICNATGNCCWRKFIQKDGKFFAGLAYEWIISRPIVADELKKKPLHVCNICYAKNQRAVKKLRPIEVQEREKERYKRNVKAKKESLKIAVSKAKNTRKRKNIEEEEEEEEKSILLENLNSDEEFVPNKIQKKKLKKRKSAGFTDSGSEDINDIDIDPSPSNSEDEELPQKEINSESNSVDEYMESNTFDIESIDDEESALFILALSSPVKKLPELSYERMVHA